MRIKHSLNSLKNLPKTSFSDCAEVALAFTRLSASIYLSTSSFLSLFFYPYSISRSATVPWFLFFSIASDFFEICGRKVSLFITGSGEAMRFRCNAVICLELGLGILLYGWALDCEVLSLAVYGRKLCWGTTPAASSCRRFCLCSKIFFDWLDTAGRLFNVCF